VSPTKAEKMAYRPPAADVHTRTQEVGDLFSYDITQPVDVGRGRSALVPILQAEADAERVVLYNPDIREKNPLTAFRLKNTTGLTLEGGPVTVFEGDSYVGEAMLETVRGDEERLVPYSVELGVSVKKSEHSRAEDVTRVSKRKTFLRKHFRRLRVTEYEFRSRLDRPLTAYLDHRFAHREREDTPEPVEITESFWRFRLTLEPRKATPFTVKEVAVDDQTIEIAGIARREIVDLVEASLIPESAGVELERIADQAEKIQNLREQAAKLVKQATAVESDQERVRKNLSALGSTSEEAKLRNKYVAKLSDEEEKIEAWRRAIEELEGQVESEGRVLEGMVDALTLP
jgi:hypothetical protein